MADLDDFFAKKDRKKSKTTKKFATADEIAKKLEDNAKKTSEKSKKDRAPAVAEGDESTTPVHVRVHIILNTFYYYHLVFNKNKLNKIRLRVAILCAVFSPAGPRRMEGL